MLWLLVHLAALPALHTRQRRRFNNTNNSGKTCASGDVRISIKYYPLSRIEVLYFDCSYLESFCA